LCYVCQLFLVLDSYDYCFFFFNDTATTEIYTLSLHDALPIWRIVRSDFEESVFSPLPKQQLDIYREALLIFYGKVSVYLKSMGRARPPEWREWIG